MGSHIRFEIHLHAKILFVRWYRGKNLEMYMATFYWYNGKSFAIASHCNIKLVDVQNGYLMNSTSFLLYLTHPYMSIFMCKYILHVTFLKAYINPNVSILEVPNVWRKNNILRIISRAQNGKLRKVPINCNSTKSIICVNNIYEYELLFAILMRQQKINNNKENLILYIKDIV